jgi:hypothetical protein
MNCVALDNLGIAGFGHNFGALDGNKPEVVNVFEAFESPANAPFIARMLFFLSPFFPSLLDLPTSTNKMLKGIKRSMKVIADDLMGRMKQEMSMVQDKHTEKSIIGLLSRCTSVCVDLISDCVLKLKLRALRRIWQCHRRKLKLRYVQPCSVQCFDLPSIIRW